ncbi:MAG: septation protein A [Proteobacteria bacterium]|nr:septation protein A [Pseudomonadota bacterium]
MKPGFKLALDIGPIFVFFAAYFTADNIFVATGVFMVATLVAVIVYKVKEGKVPFNLILTAVIVTVFGGLTLALNDDRFIKMKPTMIYALFSAMLFGGLMTGRPFLKLVFESSFPPMEHDGWKALTLRWAWFFAFSAVLNEIIWRNFSEEFWVSFKLFGFMPLTIVFAMAQMPLMNRFAIEEEEA